MPKFQRFNNRIKAWVAFDITKKGMAKVIDVKQRKPLMRFKGIPVKRK